MDQKGFVCEICKCPRSLGARSPRIGICLLCNKYLALYDRLYPNPVNAPNKTLFVLKCVQWEEFYRRTGTGGYTLEDKQELENWCNLE